MAITQISFERLDISGNNYLSWVDDVELILVAKKFIHTILGEKESTKDEKADAMIILRHHVYEQLKIEYLTEKDPKVFWESLKDRFEHIKNAILPKSQYDWMHLRFQDFKSVSEYNSMMFQITSKLKLCGEPIHKMMLEKTFSTFHASNVVLQQTYRTQGFTKYSQLISCLLVAEQNNDILLKNHECRPTGSAPVPEVNAIAFRDSSRGRGRGRGRDRGRGRGQGRGQGHGRGQRNGKYNHLSQKDGHFSRHLKWNREDYIDKSSRKQNTHSKNMENLCFRCGMKGHWSRTCRTPKHLADLYKASIIGKGKGVETNYVHHDDDDANEGPSSDTQLELSTFTNMDDEI